MDETKINFLYPSSSTTLSPQSSFNSPINPATHDLAALRQQPITLSQVYPSRKIKHSFRKRASSGSMPYYIPLRRQRTKSESQDNQGLSLTNQLSTMEIENEMEIQYTASHAVNNNNPQYNKIKIVQLKKSKSLESLNSTKDSNAKDVKEQNFSTMEFFDLNHRIQKLNLVHHD